MFQSTFLSTFDQDNEDGAVLTKRNGCAIVYKVRLKAEASQPPSISLPLLHNKSYVVKLVEPSLENLGRTRVEEKERLDPLGRVKREVDVLLAQRIAHPNLVGMFGCWEEKPPVRFDGYPSYGQVSNEAGLLFILMEYCDLLPLNKWLLSPPAHVDNKRRDGRVLFRQIMAGIAHLHSPEYRVIHRDLKPENIVLTSDLATEAVVAKIVDFGFATEKRSKMTSRIGTLWYRSPELRNEGDNRYAESADIYPAGIILCLMEVASCVGDEQLLRSFDSYMTNKAIADSGPGQTQYEPFEPQDFFSKFQGSLQDVPPELLALARRMTSGNPAERPSAAGVLAKWDSLFPEEKDLRIPYWKYLSGERRRVYAQVSPDGTFHAISPERLATVSQLTLLNVHLSTAALFSILRASPSLQLLHVEAKLSDVAGDLQAAYPTPTDPFSLPALQSIVLREILETEETGEVSAGRVESLLLSLPLSQVATNRMRLQFTLGSRLLVDIHPNSSSFHLEGLCSSRFLHVLTQLHSFQVVSLRHMTSPQAKVIPLQTWAPGLALQLQLTSLELRNVPVDLQEGRIFSTFTRLRTLRYSSELLQPLLPILSLRHLPRKPLRTLILSAVTFDLTDLDFGEEWDLDTLHLTHSRIPPEITEAFSEGCLSVESDLLLSHCHADFQPNSALFYALLQSSNLPGVLRLHPFNNTRSEDPLVAAALEFYLSAIPSDSPGIKRRQDEDNVFKFQPWNPNEDP